MPAPAESQATSYEGHTRHEVILQQLNRQIGQLFYPVENFEPDISKWEGTPIVFGPIHPELKEFETDPVAELARVGGRIVGHIRNPRVVMTGHPRLMGDMEFTDGGEMAELVSQGKLSLSTAFFCKVSNDRIMGNVRPNHVLVFTETGNTLPKDLGSMILNAYQNGEFAVVCDGPNCKCRKSPRGDEMAESEVQNAGRVISGKNAGRFKELLHSLTEFFNELTSPSGTAPPVQEGPQETPSGGEINAKKALPSPKGATDVPEQTATGTKTDRVSGKGSPDGLVHDEATNPAPKIQESRPDAATPLAAYNPGGDVGQAEKYDIAGDKEAVKYVKQAQTPQEEGKAPMPMDPGPTIAGKNLEQPGVPGPMDRTPADTDTCNKLKDEAKNWGPGCKDGAKNQSPSDPVKSGEGVPTSPVMGQVDPQTAQILNQLVEREKAIQAKEAEYVALKHQVEEIKTEQENAKWTAITNQLPKGMVSTPEKEQALRKEWKENTDAFVARVLNMKVASNTAKEGETQLGVANQHTVARGIGVRDPYTGAWKDLPAEG